MTPPTGVPVTELARRLTSGDAGVVGPGAMVGAGVFAAAESRRGRRRELVAGRFGDRRRGRVHQRYLVGATRGPCPGPQTVSVPGRVRLAGHAPVTGAA